MWRRRRELRDALVRIESALDSARNEIEDVRATVARIEERVGRPTRKGGTVMGLIEDLKTSEDAEHVQVQAILTTVTQLKATSQQQLDRITELEAQVAAGTVDPALVAQIKAQIESDTAALAAVQTP